MVLHAVGAPEGASGGSSWRQASGGRRGAEACGAPFVEAEEAGEGARVGRAPGQSASGFERGKSPVPGAAYPTALVQCFFGGSRSNR